MGERERWSFGGTHHLDKNCYQVIRGCGVRQESARMEGSEGEMSNQSGYDPEVSIRTLTCTKEFMEKAKRNLNPIPGGRPTLHALCEKIQYFCFYSSNLWDSSTFTIIYTH